MAKLCLKKPSKRLTCRKKYKIARKIRESKRKTRKDAKKNPKGAAKRGPKPIHVPNSCPFKEDILKEAEKVRQDVAQVKEAARVAAKDRRKADREKKVTEARKNASKDTDGSKKPATLADLANRAESLQKSNEAQTKSRERQAKAPSKLGTKTYANEVKKVIERADVVFEVLDARDPLGSRNAETEEMIIGSNKRLVLLLNKIDLVPRENVELWLKYLRRQFPTIAFKAATQQQEKHLGRTSFAQSTKQQSSPSTCVGAELIMKLLGNYCRHHDVKTSIRVGVVGFPNVGKSSVINSLKRKRACNVGATPGITKGLQEIELGRHIRLLDSPGMVLSLDSQLSPADLALKNAVKVEQLDDPVIPVEAILMLLYRIGEFADSSEFLSLIARKTGKLRKGAKPDLNAAAKKVLQDWNSGKIRYYTLPPADDVSSGLGVQDSQIVSEMAAEFDIDALNTDTDAVVKEMPEEGMADACELQPPKIHTASMPQGEMVVEELYDSDEMQCDAEMAPTPGAGASAKTAPNLDLVTSALGGAAAKLAGNQQLDKRQKMALKALRKKKKRNLKMAGKVVAMLDKGAMDLDDKYNFDEHF